MLGNSLKIILLKKIAIGNFLWMMGLVLCLQAFMQVKDKGYSGGFIGFGWWSHLQSLSPLSPSEFSFFLGAVVFAMSSLINLGYLIVQLTTHENTQYQF